MSKQLINSLKEERARIWNQGKEILDRANGGKLSGEDEATWKRLNSELDRIDNNITILAARERATDESLERMRASGMDRFIFRDEADMRTLDPGLKALLTGQVESFEAKPWSVNVDRKSGKYSLKNALSTTDDSGVVPTSFSRQLYEHLVELSAIRRVGPRVFRTNGGEPLVIPKTTTHASASIVAEGGTIGQSDPEFGQATLTSFKYGDLVLVSSELLFDSGISDPDLEQYLSESFAEAVANASGEHFITGDGSDKPTGVIVGGSVGVSGTLAAGPSADELIDLYYSLPGRYRTSASWLASDTAVESIRKLKNSSTDTYIWTPGLGDAPDQILGRPVVTDPYMPSAGTAATSIAFGDFGRAYALREAGELRVERSSSFKFDTDQIAFRVLQRLDGQPLDPRAIRVYVGGTA